MSRMEASKFESYVDEVILLQQLQGNNCVIKLEDYEVEHNKYRLRMVRKKMVVLVGWLGISGV